MNLLGSKVRELRESEGLLLRQVAAHIEVDTALMSKLERGERRAQREHVLKIADFLKADKDELILLWLADKIKDVIREEPLGIDALKFVEKNVTLEKK